MRIGGGVRSLNARIARLEQHVPEPQGPVVYRALFHDGTPMFTGPYGGIPDSPSVPSGGIDMTAADGDIDLRIASWNEHDPAAPGPGVGGHRGRRSVRR